MWQKLWTYANVKSQSSPQTNNMWHRTRHYRDITFVVSIFPGRLDSIFCPSNSISEDRQGPNNFFDARANALSMVAHCIGGKVSSLPPPGLDGAYAKHLHPLNSNS